MHPIRLIANGFLPTRASWMLDFVAVAMLAVSVIMVVSIFVVRFKKNPRLHRTIQIATAIVLTVALVAFEIDVRFFTKWRELAIASPFYESGTVGWSLFIHLCFAVPTPLVWAFVIVMALKKFDTSFHHETYSRIHRISGWAAVIMMFMTSITGWIFYYLAFVA